MKCIFCNYHDSKVIDSRANDNNSIRRRRECLSCGKRFTTYETVEYAPVMVVKRGGERQAFDINKLKRGIMKACEKRPVPTAKIDELIDSIEKQFTNSLEQEVESAVIGEMVMRGLKDLDEVAYVRFASVYKSFTDVTTFLKFIEQFDKNSREE